MNISVQYYILTYVAKYHLPNLTTEP